MNAVMKVWFHTWWMKFVRLISDQWQIQVLWGLKLVQFWGTSLRKRIQNYEYKIKYESEYLFGMRKEITTNFRVDKADKYHINHKIQKNNIIFLLTNC